MGRLVVVLLAGAWIAAVLLVANSQGFPSTHWWVHGFFHDTLGFSAAGADTAAAITRKCFHIPAYALVTLALWALLPPMRRKAWIVLLIVLIVAVADESLQSRQPNRGASWMDVGVDLVGALLALGLVYWWRRRGRVRNQSVA